METQVMNQGSRYELRSLPSNRRRCSISSHDISSPTKRPKKTQAFPLIKGGFGVSSDEVKFMRMLRDDLSGSGDEAVGEGSTAEFYALKAVEQDFELVESGPLAAGNIPGGRIFHLNYKAKKKDVPGAVVETFFCEVTKNKKNGITVDRNICLGPSDSLPEKADTNGCLYCLSHNIHHFNCIFAFRTGRLQFTKTLVYEVSKLRNCIKKGRKKKKISPKFQRPGVVVFEKDTNSTVDDYATAALHMFNVEQGTKFELVKIGAHVSKCLKLGHVKHFNFEAKCNNDPVHTFFAQAIVDATLIFAHFCKCLGQSDSLTDEFKLNGCQLCIPRYPWSKLVRHPPGPGYLIGKD